MDNEKDIPKTINNMLPPSTSMAKPVFSEGDSLEVNNLISIADSDITPDLLEQLEKRAREEQAKLEALEGPEESTLADSNAPAPQEDIQMAEGLPAEDGAVNITNEILERPKEDIELPKPPKVPEKMDPLEEARMNAAYKKYVIYINRNNEKFIDSLSLQERKDLINQVLTEQNTLSEQRRKEKRRTEAVVKTMIAVFTFMITIPLAYFVFNVSMEATIQNHKHSKSNFEVLYKETGKIRLNR